LIGETKKRSEDNWTGKTSLLPGISIPALDKATSLGHVDIVAKKSIAGSKRQLKKIN